MCAASAPLQIARTCAHFDRAPQEFLSSRFPITTPRHNFREIFVPSIGRNQAVFDGFLPAEDEQNRDAHAVKALKPIDDRTADLIVNQCYSLSVGASDQSRDLSQA